MNKITVLLLFCLLLNSAFASAEEDICGEVTNKLFSLKESDVNEQSALLALENIRLWFFGGSDYRDQPGNLSQYAYSRMIVEAYHIKLQRIDAERVGKEVGKGWAHEYCKYFGRKAKGS